MLGLLMFVGFVGFVSIWVIRFVLVVADPPAGVRLDKFLKNSANRTKRNLARLLHRLAEATGTWCELPTT